MSVSHSLQRVAGIMLGSLMVGSSVAFAGQPAMNALDASVLGSTDACARAQWRVTNYLMQGPTLHELIEQELLSSCATVDACANLKDLSARIDTTSPEFSVVQKHYRSKCLEVSSTTKVKVTDKSMTGDDAKELICPDSVMAFVSASWTCANGKTGSLTSTTCQSHEHFRTSAEKLCSGETNPNGKTGVNAFSIVAGHPGSYEKSATKNSDSKVDGSPVAVPYTCTELASLVDKLNMLLKTNPGDLKLEAQLKVAAEDHRKCDSDSKPVVTAGVSSAAKAAMRCEALSRLVTKLRKQTEMYTGFRRVALTKRLDKLASQCPQKLEVKEEIKANAKL